MLVDHSCANTLFVSFFSIIFLFIFAYSMLYSHGQQLRNDYQVKLLLEKINQSKENKFL
jgi:hypothetical protein